MSEDEIELVKKVPSHDRNRLKRRRITKVIVFVKKVPSHPRDRLKRRLKRQRLTKQKKMTMTTLFSLKKVPSHPRDGLKRKRKHKDDNDIVFILEIG